MNDTPSSTPEVELLLVDSYDEVLGPSGGRGFTELGRVLEPSDVNPGESRQLLDRIHSEALRVGLKARTTETRRARNINRFDFGTHTNIVATLVAAGGGALVALLKGTRPLLVQWLKNRSSRSVTIKRGDTTIHIAGDSNIAEAVKALEHLETTRPAATPKKSMKQSSKPRRASKGKGKHS